MVITLSMFEQQNSAASKPNEGAKPRRLRALLTRMGIGDAVTSV